jgi:hypothetical protein
MAQYARTRQHAHYAAYGRELMRSARATTCTSRSPACAYVSTCVEVGRSAAHAAAGTSLAAQRRPRVAHMQTLTIWTATRYRSRCLSNIIDEHVCMPHKQDNRIVKRALSLKRHPNKRNHRVSYRSGYVAGRRCTCSCGCSVTVLANCNRDRARIICATVQQHHQRI